MSTRMSRRKSAVRKSRSSRKVTVQGATSIAKRVVQNLAEKKYFDLSIDHASSNTGSLFALMANITKGVDQNQRIGDKITLRSLYFKQTVLMSSAVGETKFRALVVRPKGSIIAVTYTDILKTHSSGLFVNSAVDTDKYDILYDKVIPLTTAYRYKRVDLKMKFNKNFAYNDTLPSPAREVYFLTISDAIVNTPYVAGNLRISYIDV